MAHSRSRLNDVLRDDLPNTSFVGFLDRYQYTKSVSAYFDFLPGLQLSGSSLDMLTF